MNYSELLNKIDLNSPNFEKSLNDEECFLFKEITEYIHIYSETYKDAEVLSYHFEKWLKQKDIEYNRKQKLKKLGI